MIRVFFLRQSNLFSLFHIPLIILAFLPPIYSTVNDRWRVYTLLLPIKMHMAGVQRQHSLRYFPLSLNQLLLYRFIKILSIEQPACHVILHIQPQSNFFPSLVIQGSLPCYSYYVYHNYFLGQQILYKQPIHLYTEVTPNI